ncbi:hypothetical protein FE784_16365 [Paenibacillus hemerocallicola]|uniref:DUF2577 domain-containing protein n=1 Tax=Paenibacillus hemerocallicola TaxID=1172614 RepID=A0A5C4T9A3_9BACL|nr:hypothetical protein [Paenibacillus hemerocallicola]TNJ65170.1 hypothetical protein FE784_16365 [Paenibacillus hemerocallicola]
MDPYKKLATVLESRMAGHAATAVTGVPAELGTITGSGLKLDSFKHEMTDYLVAEWETKLKLPAFSLRGSITGTLSGSGEFQFEETEIEGAALLFKDGLKPGDRVLAVPVAGGSEAVVICKVVR